MFDAHDRPGFEPVESRRLSFGQSARDYDDARPSYPEAALRWLLGDEPRKVLDLGSGTGRLGALAARLGHEVLAVEPDPRMRELAERALPGRVRAGNAEAIPLVDCAVDAVLVGQAWHWFTPERAVPEVARVLAPGGVLGILWNMRDESEPWVTALGEIVGGEDRLTRDAELDLDLGTTPWPVDRKAFPHRQTLDAGGLVRLAGTWSYVRVRPDCDAVLQRVAKLAASHPDLVERERIELPYVCLTIRARRPADGP
jgi:SAM-dependent methyltransferase